MHRRHRAHALQPRKRSEVYLALHGQRRSGGEPPQGSVVFGTGDIEVDEGTTMRITLCGSTRFEPLFHEWNHKLALAGHTVYSLSLFGREAKDARKGDKKIV